MSDGRETDIEIPLTINTHEEGLIAARSIAGLSECKRLQVGALIDDCGDVACYGTNKSVDGCGCEEENVTRDEVVHAEMDCLLRFRPKVDMAPTMFITHAPCKECAKHIVAGGILVVVYSEDYRDREGVRMLLKNDLKVFKEGDEAGIYELFLRDT